MKAVKALAIASALFLSFWILTIKMLPDLSDIELADIDL